MVFLIFLKTYRTNWIFESFGDSYLASF